MLGEKFATLIPTLNERSRRVYAATEARAWGYGGIEAVSEVSGLARSTIARGLKELQGKAKTIRDSVLLNGRSER